MFSRLFGGNKVHSTDNSVNSTNGTSQQTINWETITSKNVRKFTLSGLRTFGKVVDVYDGDTCQVVFPLNGELYRWSVRLQGIDTPEIRGKTVEEKERGIYVRDKLREKILDQVIVLDCMDFDKYGRPLAKLYMSQDDASNQKDISSWLIENKYGVEYFGGKKQAYKKVE
jgi:micrococcal nuclease